MCKPSLSPLQQNPGPSHSSASFGPLTTRSGSVQDSWVRDHTSLLHRELTIPKSIPTNCSLPPFQLAYPENPSRASLAPSKPRHRCRLCVLLSRPAKSLSSSPLTLSPEPPYHLAHRLGGLLPLCVCVPLALCYGICLRFCLTIVRVGMCVLVLYMFTTVCVLSVSVLNTTSS